MITLSYRQPMPTLIALGIKPIENRTWRLPERYKGKRVLIHASGKPWTWQHTLAYIRSLEHGEEILEIFAKNNFNGEWLRNLPTSAIIGSVVPTDCVINHPSVWAEKTGAYNSIRLPDIVQPRENKIVYNWVLSDPVLFDQPILDVKGKLNFWEYNGKIPVL